jgi:hypothetical protein
MPAKGTGAPVGDAFELREDGTVWLRWEDHEVTLRRPKLREWGAILEEADTANAWFTGEGRTTKDLAGAENPYPDLYASVCERLSGQTFARDDMPLWCVDAKVFNRFNVHWLALPLAPGGSPEPRVNP